MPTANAQSGTVDLDRTLQGFTGNREGQFERFLKENPECRSHDAAIGKSGLINDSMRVARDKRVADRQAEIAHVNKQLAFVTQNAPRVFEWQKDENGEDKKVYKDTPAEKAIARIAELNAENEADRKQTWPPNYQTVAREGAIKFGAKRLTPVPMDDFANTLGIKEIWDGELKPAHDELKAVKAANITTEEGIENIRAEFAAVKARGSLDFSLLAAGGSFDTQGNYRPFPSNPRTQLPDAFINGDVSVSVGEEKGVGIATLILPDLWPVLCALDDGRMLAAIEAQFAAYNSRFRQIKLADKPRMIADLESKILTASRRLEFACRQREAQGIPTWRPKNVDWRTLLWVEAAPAVVTPITNETKSKPEVKPAKKRMINPGDEIPGDDDGDEMDFG